MMRTRSPKRLKKPTYWISGWAERVFRTLVLCMHWSFLALNCGHAFCLCKFRDLCMPLGARGHQKLFQVQARSSQVLGVAVARGRLSHLLQQVAPGHDCDAELLLELFVVRELPRVLEVAREALKDQTRIAKSRDCQELALGPGTMHAFSVPSEGDGASVFRFGRIHEDGVAASLGRCLQSTADTRLRAPSRLLLLLYVSFGRVHVRTYVAVGSCR